jgi:transcriptional regulator with XRE-family HTH domain
LHNPDKLETLGDHLKARRLDLGLYQKDVARRLGVTTDSVAYWENNCNQPSLKMFPCISQFLGYDPLEYKSNSLSLGELVVHARQRCGMTQKDLARQLGVDPRTLAHWEYSRRSLMAPQHQLVRFPFILTRIMSVNIPVLDWKCAC